MTIRNVIRHTELELLSTADIKQINVLQSTHTLFVQPSQTAATATPQNMQINRTPRPILSVMSGQFLSMSLNFLRTDDHF